MTAVRVGLALTAVLVCLGVVYGIGGYLSTGNDVAVMFLVGAVYFGVPALAVIWLGVFVAVVIQKGIRVLGDGDRS